MGKSRKKVMRRSRDEIERRLNSRVLLLDGAYGSLLGGEHPELLSLTHPVAVMNLHLEYLRAGADIICTNTFNACSLPTDEIAAVCEAAARIAEKAAGDRAIVAGVVSPFGDNERLRAQISALVNGGVDILWFETILSCENIAMAYEVACEVEKEMGLVLPKVFSATATGESGRLISGESLEEFADSAVRMGAIAIGLNCGDNPEKSLEYFSQLKKSVDCRTIFYPSAGLPGSEVSVERFGEIIRDALTQGAGIVGGCCGTTPAYIAHLRKVIDKFIGQ